MAIVDRIQDPVRPFSNHAFSAACWFWAKGEITQADLKSSLGLDASDDAQLEQLASHYAGLSQGARLTFHSDLEAAGILLYEGLITPAKYKGLLGLT